MSGPAGPAVGGGSCPGRGAARVQGFCTQPALALPLPPRCAALSQPCCPTPPHLTAHTPTRPPAHPPTRPLAAKREGDQLFECFDAQDLNQRLKDLMPGLSVKVGRAVLGLGACRDRACLDGGGGCCCSAPQTLSSLLHQ